MTDRLIATSGGRPLSRHLHEPEPPARRPHVRFRQRRRQRPRRV